MQIFGVDITKVRKAAATPVTVPKSVTNTKPSVPLRSAQPRAELGDSGTRMMSGIITEEYNPQLQGQQGVKIFDQMRKSDGTVRAAVLCCTLPIQRARWFTNAATQDEQGKEIANFVKHALFDWIEGMTWDDIIRHALLSVSFGVMVFEKVYGTYEHEGKTYVTLKKLAPRMPKSIQQWELPDKTFGIQQIRQDGQLALIPGSKLLIFVNEREGNNWWGTSMLRAAYKHWYYKDKFYTIDAMAFERQGLGVVHISMPVGYTESDERKAANAAGNLRANESTYLLTPPNYTAEFMDMGSNTTRDPEKSINHHNKEILQSVLAQFLELGQTKTGSRATSQDHSDLFLKAMEAIAKNIASTISKDLIKELVDLNFDGVTNYPVLDFSDITKADVVAVSTAYAALTTSGGITSSADDEDFFRALLGLPPKKQDADATSEEQLDHVDIEEEDDTIDTETPPATAQDKKQVDTATKKNDTTKKKASHTHLHLKRKFDDGKGFKSWRPLTFAEQKVSLQSIQDTMDKLEEEFTVKAKRALQDAKNAYMAKLHPALEAGDTNAIKALEISFVAEYKSILKEAMQKAYQYGKTNASSEMGINTPPSSAASMANIELQADTIANKTASDIEAKAKITVANALKSTVSALQSAGTIDAKLEEAIQTSIENTSGIIIAQSLNSGRNDVFARNRDDIYALQRSEILDKTTCNFCISMDQRTIDKNDDWANTEIFHSNCRGIWVEILKDEQDPPEIGGIPANLGDYYGSQPNDLIQPPRPMPLPGSLADQFVKEKNKKK